MRPFSTRSAFLRPHDSKQSHSVADHMRPTAYATSASSHLFAPIHLDRMGSEVVELAIGVSAVVVVFAAMVLVLYVS